MLSACDTAVGPIVGQEGVLNIARAFLLAGAHSVITTLWAVSDATSTALMRRFYENITAGQDIAEALMRSKAAVIEQFGPEALADRRRVPACRRRRSTNHIQDPAAEGRRRHERRRLPQHIDDTLTSRG